MGTDQRKYFEQENLWAEAVREQNDVAVAIRKLFPSDVMTILDAGCGNGIVTNRYAQDYEVYACDFSITAIKSVAAPRFATDLSSLPLRDRIVDLTLLTDVLEHVPDASYAATLAEISRVTKKYVLVAVPNEELSNNAEVECPICRTRFHAHHHQRSYSAANFDRLQIPGFRPRLTTTAGEKWLYSERDVLLAAQVATGKDYNFPNAMCPCCGSRRGDKPTEPKIDQLERRFQALQAALVENGWCRPAYESELLVLFERDYAGPNRIIGRGDALWDDYEIEIGAMPSASAMTTYPTVPSMVAIDTTAATIQVPRPPRSITVLKGAVDAVRLLDPVLQDYAPCIREGEVGEYKCAPVATSSHGAVLMIESPDPSRVSLELKMTGGPGFNDRDQEFIRLEVLTAFEDPIKYYPHSYLVGSLGPTTTIIVPRLPESIKVVDGGCESIWIFDFVGQRFEVCQRQGQQDFKAPRVAHGPDGVVLRIDLPSAPNLGMLLTYSARLTENEIRCLCFGL